MGLRGQGSGSKTAPRQLRETGPPTPGRNPAASSRDLRSRHLGYSDLNSGDRDRAACRLYRRNLTERWGRRRRRSCRRPHIKLIAILPGRERLLSRMRTHNFEAAGEAILEMGRKSAMTSQRRGRMKLRRSYLKWLRSLKRGPRLQDREELEVKRHDCALLLVAE